MTIRSILMAGVAGAALMAAPVAMAQTQQDKSTTSMPSSAMPSAASTQVDHLVGQSVENTDGKKVGDIEAVYVRPDGKVDSVILGVGGFLGMGEREVAVKWSDLNVSADGKTITTAMTKDQLKALPEYEFKDKAHRGQVFSDTGMMRTDRKPSDMASMPNGKPAGTMAMDKDKTTMDKTAMDKPMKAEHKGFTRTGEMSGEVLIGASVKNTEGETIGDIKDIHLNKNGSVKAVVVGVGGFLGLGERDVLISWNQLTFTRDDANGGDLIVHTDVSKASLQEMPEYQM